ncbi:ring-opening amidohydrolase [Microlunatus elymi]|nr:ring-opening amidohydrolase [Microlunatus elymi]
MVAETQIDAVRVPMAHTGDVCELDLLLTDGRLHPDDVIAVTGKVEDSNTGGNSRVDADHAVRRFLAERGTRSEPEIGTIPMVFTTGGVGILTPHLVVYSRSRAEPAPDGGPRLAVGTARSARMLPQWTGTARVIEANADAVRAAADDAGLLPEQTEYVVGKAYHPSQQALAAARAAGKDIDALDDDTLFRKTSGSAALGVAVATHELALPSGNQVGVEPGLWSGRACISANAWEPVGGNGPDTQLILMGNRPGAGGRLRVGRAVIGDLLDVDALPRALRRAGLEVGPGPLTADQRARVIAVYVKIGLPPDGLLRGRRQVIESPSYSGEVKIAAGAMFAGWLQDTMIYLSGSASHQGPPGGGTLAVIVDVS